MNWNEISAAEAEKHPAYGFGGGLYIVYAITLIWVVHSAYIVFLDTNYELTKSYGYENFTMADFTSFIQIVLALPFLYLSIKKSPIMPSVAVSMLSLNWAIWFTFGMIRPEAIAASVVVSAASLFMILYLMLSVRVNVTYRHRVRA